LASARSCRSSPAKESPGSATAPSNPSRSSAAATPHRAEPILYPRYATWLATAISCRPGRQAPAATPAAARPARPRPIRDRHPAPSIARGARGRLSVGNPVAGPVW
jgi:hypothetical protein